MGPLPRKGGGNKKKREKGIAQVTILLCRKRETSVHPPSAGGRRTGKTEGQKRARRHTLMWVFKGKKKKKRKNDSRRKAWRPPGICIRRGEEKTQRLTEWIFQLTTSRGKKRRRGPQGEKKKRCGSAPINLS